MAASFAVNMATLIVGTAAFTWWRKRLERAIDKKIDWKYSLTVRKAHLADWQEQWQRFVTVTENLNTANAARRWLSEFML